MAGVTWCVVFCQNQLSATSPVLVSASAMPVTPRRHLAADWTMKGDAGMPERWMKINRKFHVHETDAVFRGFAPLSSGHDLRVSILKRHVGRRLSRGCVEGPRILRHLAGVTTWRFNDRGWGQRRECDDHGRVTFSWAGCQWVTSVRHCMEMRADIAIE